MKAVIFAAGIGSRLKPFTDYHPKALAEIAGKPMLGHVIDKLVAAGADDIVVNVHHFPEQIEAYLAKEYPSVRVSDESDLLLDTAGALAKIYREHSFREPFASGEPIVVHNADIYTDFAMTDMLSAYGEGRAVVLVDPKRDSSRQLLFDVSDRMIGWRNIAKNIVRPASMDIGTAHGAAFGGVHILSPEILADIDSFCGPVLHPCSIIDYYISACGKKNIMAFTPTYDFKWFDIGTSEKLATARMAIESEQ